jgi:hypothetical protein
MQAYSDATPPQLDREQLFREFCVPLLGLPVSHVWQGHGSAIFLEFGDLRQQNRLDGSPGNPFGQWTLMMEWSWRIEGKRRIWCGSWSREARWPRAFARLQGARVVSASLTGRLPEVDIALSNGLHVLSMMTAEGDPAWALINRCGSQVVSLSVRAGRLHQESDPLDI